jgi:hypothetical protein
MLAERKPPELTAARSWLTKAAESGNVNAQYLLGRLLSARFKLAEIPGVSENLARSVIAEVGLDMTRFPTAGHLVSWAGVCASARQSGPRTWAGRRARETATCAAPSARPQPARPAPPPSSASATPGSPAAAARPKPRSQ